MARVDTERKIMNQKFRNRLREMLDETGVTQRMLAHAIEVSPAAISKYLSYPDREPQFNIVARISKYFDISPEWLGGLSDERTPFQQGTISDIYYRLSNTGKTELFNYGEYLLHKEQLLSEEAAPYRITPKGQRLAEPSPADEPTPDKVAFKIIPKVADFAISVSGSAMEPLIKNGTLVFAKDQSSAENEDVVIAEVDGEITCRKYFNKGGRIELHPINLMYEPITEYESMRILGKVII